MKLLKWIDNNILLVLTLFLLAFIPLYPKFPLIDVKGTWVYVRIEDFLVAFTALVWLVQLIRKKVTFRTPLTIPIVSFWVAGLVSTAVAIIFLFPTLPDVSTNVALLHWARRLEYLCVFFIAFSAVRSKGQLKYILLVLLTTLIVVCLYGYGQRGYLIGYENRFPAFSTMNEEFAKGEPLYLALANRIQSTFAGHYDLAAYLVMLIPIMGSMVFGTKKWIMRLIYLSAAVMGLWLLMMTASRVSFGVYLVTIVFTLFIQKQKKWIIPVVIASILLLSLNKGLTDRLRTTITEEEYAYDQVSNQPIGKVDKEGDKYVIKVQEINENLNPSQTGVITSSGSDKDDQETTEKIEIRRKKIEQGKAITVVDSVEGNFVIRKSFAIDESFAIRFQGSWPRAIEAFKKNIFLGTGYSTINLATDNNYLRILGETGIIGLMSYVSIFIIFFIFVYRSLPAIDNEYTKRFVVGVAAGIFGLGVNALLIDVFEASKVAFVLWMLIGLVTGLLWQYHKKKIDYLKDIRNIFFSTPAIIFYLLLTTFILFGRILSHYFVADDFTWLRWAAECREFYRPDGSTFCEPIKSLYTRYFFEADNFFYRPGTKIFFHFMYNKVAWLNANVYHLVSLLLHFATSSLVFLISLKLLKKRLVAGIIAFVFLAVSSHSEAIFWISSIGHLFSAFFILAALYAHILWKQHKNILYLPIVVGSIILAPLFQESGIIAILFLFAYDLFYKKGSIVTFRNIKSLWYYILYILPVPLYFIMRTIANSHWSGGDYSYNLLKLPLNFAGNIVGYIGLIIGGNSFVPFYDQLRTIGRNNVLFFAFCLGMFLFIIVLLRRHLLRLFQNMEKRTLYFSLILFVVSLLPFLGLGNITSRYAYLASFAMLLFFGGLGIQILENVKKKYKYGAIGVMLVCVLLFALYHLQALQKINQDWERAGEVTNNLLINFNYAFIVTKATPPNPVFYFINTPIKQGNAWVFPVGLNDALWFTFQKENLTVHQFRDLNLALDAAEGSTSARVFEFDKDGDVAEVMRTIEKIPAK